MQKDILMDSMANFYYLPEEECHWLKEDNPEKFLIMLDIFEESTRRSIRKTVNEIKAEIWNTSI